MSSEIEDLVAEINAAEAEQMLRLEQLYRAVCALPNYRRVVFNPGLVWSNLPRDAYYINLQWAEESGRLTRAIQTVEGI